MPKSFPRPCGKYKRESFGKSLFDDKPTLIVNRYWLPKPYIEPVNDVITAFKHDVPFNRAVDQVAALYPNIINRNKLAEHTLKFIANQF